MSLLLLETKAPPASPAGLLHFVIEIALGGLPGEWPYTWTTIHDTANPDPGYVRSWAFRRGRTNPLGQSETGTGSLILNNLNREWDPNNTASPFYPYVRPMLPIRGSCVVEGQTYFMFLHYADGFPRRRIGPNYSEVTLSTVDGQEGLALARIPPEKATLTVMQDGVNNDLVFTAKQPGPEGNDITVAFFQTHFAPLRHQRVVVTVTGTNIRVDYIDGSVQVDEVVAALLADVAAMRLVDVANAPGSAGDGDMHPYAETHLTGGDTTAFPEELGGARISRCLDLANWPTTLRTISTGQDNHAALAFSTQEDGKLISHMQDVTSACSENGLLYVNGAGRMVFLDRVDKLTEHSTASAVLSDIPDPGQFPYVDIVPNQSKDLIVNDAVCTRDGGDPQAAYDATSVDTYRRRSRSFSTTLATDLHVLAAVQAAVVELKDPLQRVEQVSVMPGDDEACWQAMLSIDVGARVTVHEHAAAITGTSLYGEGPYGEGLYGTGDVVATDTATDYIVQGLSWQFPPGPHVAGRVTYQLWPADPISNWFILDDPVRGELDAGNRLGR